MSHETERRADRYLLSDDESQIIFDRLIAGRRFAHLAPVDHPAVHFFGGQPGAGKSSIQDSTVEQLRSADGYDTVAQVIGDELRAYHPMYDSLLSSGDEDAAFYTDRDSGRWVEQSIDFVLGRRLHLVLEGTLRSQRSRSRQQHCRLSVAMPPICTSWQPMSSSAAAGSFSATSARSPRRAAAATPCLKPTTGRTRHCHRRSTCWPVPAGLLATRSTTPTVSRSPSLTGPIRTDPSSST